MRGKTKAQTRYSKIRNQVLDNSFRGANHYLFSTIKEIENINNIIYGCCDHEENLDWFLRTPPNILYRVLKIANKPVILRDLELFAELVFSDGKKSLSALRALAESIIILYSLNLIEVKISRELDEIKDMSNKVFVFVKDDNS